MRKEGVECHDADGEHMARHFYVKQAEGGEEPESCLQQALGQQRCQDGAYAGNGGEGRELGSHGAAVVVEVEKIRLCPETWGIDPLRHR